MKTFILFIFLIIFTLLVRSQDQSAIDYRKYAFRITASDENFRNGTSGSSGTGFMLKKDSKFYFVTAVHVVKHNKDSKFSVFTDVPTYLNSYKQFRISRTNYSEPMHFGNLRDDYLRSINYGFYQDSSGSTLDLAIIEINNPAEELRKYTINLDSLLLVPWMMDGLDCILVGYPKRDENSYLFKSTTAADRITFNKGMVFDVKAQEKMSGISGGPVFVNWYNQGFKVAGIFLGAQEKPMPMGLVIYAHFVKSIIDQIRSSKTNQQTQ